MRQSRYDFHPITESEAREAIAWQYAPPQDFYNLDPAPSKQAQHLAYYLNPQHQIYRVSNIEGRFLACASFGRDARVAGADYALAGGDVPLDFGLWLNPSLVGSGLGYRICVAQLDFARATFGARHFRATIADFNSAPQRVVMALKFNAVQRFAAKQSGEIFQVFVRFDNPLIKLKYHTLNLKQIPSL